MYLVQIILVALLAWFIFKTFLRYRRGDLRLASLLSWLGFWFVGVAIVIWPDSTFYFAHLLGIGRGADLVIYVSIIFLFYLVFRLFVMIEKQKNEITKLNREVTLKNNSTKYV